MAFSPGGPGGVPGPPAMRPPGGMMRPQGQPGMPGGGGGMMMRPPMGSAPAGAYGPPGGAGASAGGGPGGMMQPGLRPQGQPGMSGGGMMMQPPMGSAPAGAYGPPGGAGASTGGGPGGMMQPGLRPQGQPGMSGGGMMMRPPMGSAPAGAYGPPGGAGAPSGTPYGLAAGGPAPGASSGMGQPSVGSGFGAPSGTGRGGDAASDVSSSQPGSRYGPEGGGMMPPPAASSSSRPGAGVAGLSVGGGPATGAAGGGDGGYQQGSQQGPTGYDASASRYGYDQAGQSRKERRSQLALRTTLGPVPFRPRRQPVRMAVDGTNVEVEIKKLWLKTQKDGAYHRAVKQAMLVAASQYKIFDAQDPSTKISDVESDRAKQRMAGLLRGQERIPVSGSKKKTLAKIESLEMRERDVMVKFSKSCCVAGCGSAMKRRERSFVIDNGRLQIFYYKTKGAKHSDDYELKDATCSLETRAEAQIPRWDPKYTERLRVDVNSRIAKNKSPIYLYSDNHDKLVRWKRAFALAKVLVAENDRRALKVSIGRATSQGLMKAWEALTRYYKELKDTRDTVKQMAMRLMKVELSRGWTKMKLLYRSRVDEEARKEEQRTWAARFMSEKLAKLGDMNARSAADVRENVITRIQQRFRRYREDKIFDRAYPLGPEMMSKLQQARLGCTVDFEMRTVSSDDAVRMSLSPVGVGVWEKSKELLRGTKATYSEVNEPVSQVTLFVSDNLASLSFSMQTEAKDAFSALGKADWSKYINMDRISSIVLHAAPPVSGSLKRDVQKGSSSVWLSINGPRLGWDKIIENGEIKTGDRVENGMMVLRRLTSASSVGWMSCKVTAALSNMSSHGEHVEVFARIHVLGYSFTSAKTTEQNPDFAKDVDFLASVPSTRDVFGPSHAAVAVEVFKEETVPDEDETKPPHKVTSLLYVGSGSMAGLIEELRAKIMEQAGAGVDETKKPPMELKQPVEQEIYVRLGSPPFGGDTTLFDSSMTLRISCTYKEDKVSPMHAQLGETVQCVSPELVGGGVVTSIFTSHRQAWFDPDLGVGKFRNDNVSNFVEFSLGTLRFPAKMTPHPLERKMYRIRVSCGGVATESIALHRPEQGWDKVIGATYGDVMSIHFSGSRLFLPLPPGCWSRKDLDKAKEGTPMKDVPKLLPEIKIMVFELSEEPEAAGGGFAGEGSIGVPGLSMEPIDYANFLAYGSDKRKTKAKTWQQHPLFVGCITLDNFRADIFKTASIFLSEFHQESDKGPNTLVHANMAMMDDPGLTNGDEALLRVDLALRDRDFVKGMLGEASQKQALCVGDKAMLTVAEPFVYPESDLEFRKRFCPGEWKKKELRKGTNPWERGCNLRPPCLSSEYAESGLGDLVPKEPFKQSFIPAFCKDIVPHTFILPLTEKEHLDRGLPGFFPEIVKDLYQHGDAEKRDSNLGGGGRRPLNRRTGPAKPICRYLKEMNRKVPCTVLCMYPDGTCDVELSTNFITSWQANPETKYRIPGYLERYPEPPKLQQRAGVPAQKESINGPSPRCVLKRVPTTLLRAVHYSSINIYDSFYRNTADVLRGKQPLNDFNPKKSLAHLKQLRNEQFVLAAGPMPPDVSEAACQYEWSIRVRSDSEVEMYQLAAMLCRVHRMDHYQQAFKMAEYRSRLTTDTTQALRQQQQQQQMLFSKPVAGGQLDVLLLEARRLMPRQTFMQKVLHADPASLSLQSLMNPQILGQTANVIRSDQPLDENWFQSDQILTNEDESKALAGTTVRPSTPTGTPISCFVNFRMLHNRGEVLPYRGQRVQQSSMISGTDSPNWSTVDALKRNGGYLFRSGTIDPDRHPDLIIDFEVRQALYGYSKHVGGIQLPVTQRQFLTNPNEPFKNLWLPLITVQDGKATANPTGEIHIMTRWLPAEKIQIMADGTQKQQLSVRQFFLKELWPRLSAQRLREPIYNIEAQYVQYNPNLIKPKKASDPEAEPLRDFVRRHAEELANAVPYVECLERRQTQAWDEFEQQLDQEQPGVRMAERRLMWTESSVDGANPHVEKLQILAELVQRGIPSAKRERLWQELTLASRVMERGEALGSGRIEDGEAAIRAAEQEYERLLKSGLPQTSDAMRQLQEDGFAMAQWDSSVPPTPKFRDIHLKRVQKSQNVCTALITMPDSGIAYCESLLVLAFYMLLPQGCKDEKVAGDGCHYFSESSVFWMLYTLISTRVNGAYRLYYGVPRREGEDASHSPDTLCAGSGAMQDVLLLECCLAWHQPDTWKKMNALGFQLPTVFYGAFMRLFATYMPTATVFRFWDLLFSQSTDHTAQPHVRSHLVDLAFGVIKSKEREILACQSAIEVRDAILNAFGSIYDTCTVVDLTMLSHQFLWFGSGFSSGKVWLLHTQREDLFKTVNSALAEQNDILRLLTHVLRVKLRGQADTQSDAPGVTVKELLKSVLPVLSQSLQNFAKLKPENKNVTEKMQTVGMHRPAPLASHELAAGTFEKLVHNFQKHLQSLRVQNMDPMPFKVRAPMAFHNKDRVPESMRNQSVPGLEPVNITSADLRNALERELPSWYEHSTALWNAFTKNRQLMHLMGTGAYGTGYGMEGQGYAGANAQDPSSAPLLSGQHYTDPQHGYYNPYADPSNPGAPRQSALASMLLKVTSYFGFHEKDAWLDGLWGRASAPNGEMDQECFSLNELFLSLICASRGTVGEKANALFNIYSYNDPRYIGTAYHINPVSKLAKSIVNAEGTIDVVGATLSPPDPNSEGAKSSNALRFEVWTNYPNGPRCMGDVLVPNLGAFMSFMGQEPQSIIYNIWGDPTEWSRGAKTTAASSSIRWDASKQKCLGELNMSVSWTPSSIRKTEEGQLMIRVHYIKFYSMHVSDYYKINPWVKVSMSLKPPDATVDEAREWLPIKRWDPRKLIGSSAARSKLTTVGAYGGDIKFDQTMRDDRFLKQGEKFHTFMRESKGMGFETTSQQWQWNEAWGKQFSEEKTLVQSEFVKTSTRKNVIDMQSVRLITSGILQRCMLNMTNRQAALIAEATFNRQGVVPGILKAILVPSERGDEYTLWSQLEEKMKKSDFVYRDMTDAVVLEHEKQVAMNGGLLNLFSDDWLWCSADGKYNPIGYGLQKMHVDDPFKTVEKVLWIRYVRGGDGERCFKAVRFDKDGILKPREGSYTPEIEMEQMNIWPQTKVTKEEFVSCLISSPILGESLRRLGCCDHVLHQKRCIPLDVAIMDPRHEEEEEAFNDMFDFQQSVLLEVWDADPGRRDFLGEAWLPPFATLGKRPKELVLPLQKADFSEDQTNGGTRPDSAKDLGDDTKDINKKVTGHLFVTVTWEFPIWKDIDQEKDFKEWLESQAGLPDPAKNQQRADALAKMGYSDVKALGDAWDKDKKLLAKLFEKDGKDLKFSSNELKALSAYFALHFGEEVHLRAVQQEKLHTGNLTIRLREAKMLRKADIRLGRECDPQVSAFIRNDHLNAWVKKKLFASTTKMNSSNPVWNTDHGPFPIMTGSHQARYQMPEAGFMTEVNKQLLNFQPKKKRHLSEDRNLASVKRFGHEGLHITFRDPSQTPAEPTLGMNHGIDVMIGDSIREFKVKLTAACQKEAAFWKGRNDGAHRQYSDITIGYKHLVMVFVPSLKVQKLQNQKLVESSEFKRQYDNDQQDPSNWQPLDPARNFVQYQQYAFGQRSVMLRIVEETPSYKAQNLRYKLFDEEMTKLPYLDKDEPTVCYGWAKYTHKVDGSVEWRQAFVSKIDDKDKPWEASWVFDPTTAEDFARQLNTDKTKSKFLEHQERKARLDRKEVLLNPRLPKLDDTVIPEHEEILKQAIVLRQSGKSDWEIEGVLNQLLRENAASEGAIATSATPITVDEIRAYCQRQQEALK